jgi:hypothetical protein
MAQHDYIIANQSGAAFRSDLNNGLAAIVSNNSGAAQPSTTYAYQWWADTTTGLLKLRNAANNAWITIGTLADANLGLLSLAGGTLTGALLLDDSGTVSAPALAFDGDTNTGIWRSAADTLNVATNGVENLEFGTTEVVFNDGGADIDFRVEGDTKANLFKVDAGADAVSIDGAFSVAGDATVNSINGGPLAGMRNRIINGSFAIGQRGTTFASSANNDDAYTLDRWYILSDGNDAIDVTQETSVVPANQTYAIALDVETANKKFGIAQIIESDNCVGLTGGTVSLSFKAKVSATTKLDNVKAAVVAWSGTADTVTSDIISAWGAEGTNPTLIANATYENTPANLSVTTSYATYSLTANIDTASTTNIIVFIWSDVTDTTAGDFLYVTDVQLEPGSVATPFERRSYGQELMLAQRYALALTSGQASSEEVIGHGYCAGGIAQRFAVNFPTTMRATPTLAFASGSAANLITDVNGSSPGTFAIENGSPFRTNITRTVTGGTSGLAGHLRVNGVSDVRWIASSEL